MAVEEVVQIVGTFTPWVAGAALLLLAALLLVLRFSSRVHQVFALFLALQGLRQLLGGTVEFETSGTTLLLLLHVIPYLLIALPFVLLRFVSIYPRPRGPFGRRAGGWVLMLAAGVAEAAYFLDHSLFALITVTPDARVDEFIPGPLSLARGTLTLVVAAAALVFAREVERAVTRSRRMSVLIVHLGFLLGVLHEWTLRVFTVLRSGLGSSNPWTLASDGLTLLAIIPAATSSFFVWRHRGLVRSSRRSVGAFAYVAALVSAIGSAIVVKILESDPDSFTAGPLGAFFLGMWLIALPVFVTYALARHELFDIDLRLRAGVRLTILGLMAIAVYAGVAWLASFVAPTAVGVGLGLAAAAAALFLSPGFRNLSRRLAHGAFAEIRDDDAYRERRRLEVYRDALIQEMERHGPHPPYDAIERLRQDFGIDERTHDILQLSARAHVQGLAAGQDAPDPRYRLKKPLGAGGHARTWVARDTTLDRDVVLKQPLTPWIMTPAGRTTFLDEARAMAKVQHPNVVTIYETLTDRSPPALVLEYVDGGNLDTRIRSAPLDPAYAFSVSDELLKGLSAVHDAGLVHGDVKPSNVFLRRDGTAVLGDFGIAAPPDAADTMRTLALPEAQAGTPAYMSPEQVLGSPTDARSDLYSLAALLLEALTGRHYLGLERASVFETHRAVVETEPRLDDAAIPGPLRALLAKALSKDPSKRPADAAAFRKQLARASKRIARDTTRAKRSRTGTIAETALLFAPFSRP